MYEFSPLVWGYYHKPISAIFSTMNLVRCHIRNCRKPGQHVESKQTLFGSRPPQFATPKQSVIFKYLNIQIFKNICHKYLFGHSLVLIFIYEYIQTFISIIFLPILYPYTAERRNALGNTSTEDRKISRGWGFYTPRPRKCTPILSASARKN